MQLFKILRRKTSFMWIVLLFSAIFATGVNAQERSYLYDSIDVTVDVHADSTMLVNEKLNYRFNGTYRAVERGITLLNPENVSRCKADPTLQCGGFEFINITSIKGNGKPLKKATEDMIYFNSEGRPIAPPEYYFTQEEFVNGENRLVVYWVFDENGKFFNDENLTLEIEYEVFGGLGYFEDYDLFYWNTIFPDRTVSVRKATVEINSPAPLEISDETLSIPDFYYEYTKDIQDNGKRITLTTENLLAQEDFTVLLKYPKGMISQYTSLNFDLNPSKQNLKINNEIELENIKESLKGLPAGTYSFEFSAKDRLSKEIQLSISEGETRTIEVSLDYTRQGFLKYVFIIAGNVLGILLLPIGLIFVYQLWSKKGRDKIQSKVIVPEYKIPDDIAPFALGSLKDEAVDIVDITATLIDLAYRGYIKIKEFEATEILGIKIKAIDYELIKLKEFDDLTEPEKEIMQGVFGTKVRITTQELKNKFSVHISAIKKSIYNFLVNKNYFSKNPDDVRNTYLGIGVMFAVIGGLTIYLGFVYYYFIGLGISLLMLGCVVFLISKHMPSKTESGSKLFHKVLGFKMYLETAEKYRVQNLTPDMFEKFLSYAIVFGIEKQWADKFKDIYKGSPSWFEGSSTDPFTTLYLVNAMRSFTTTTSSYMYSSKSSSGSSFGGGWSGGGGFSGGFSGGGGGGGGGGAW